MLPGADGGAAVERTAPGPGVLRDPEPPADAPFSPGRTSTWRWSPPCADRRGFRLGFGGGYYDRWLSGFSGFTVGLCRDCVLQDRVPTEDHDCRVDLLLTETRRFSAETRRERGSPRPSAGPSGSPQHPQPLSQPQPPQLFPQPQLFLQRRCRPSCSHSSSRMMISRMIHRQLLPPQPLFPQHISFHLTCSAGSLSRAF